MTMPEMNPIAPVFSPFSPGARAFGNDGALGGGDGGSFHGSAPYGPRPSDRKRPIGEPGPPRAGQGVRPG